MKKQILKIAGVKSEKEFYKKFPTEEAFMKAHGKAFKKAQIGTYMTSQAEIPVYSPADVRGMYDELEYQLTGMTSSDREKIEALGGIADQYGIDPSMLQMASEEILNTAPPAAKRGKKIKKAANGVYTEPEPRIEDYPDYNSWKSDWDAWNQNRMSSTGATGGGNTTTTIYAPSTSTSTTAAPVGGTAAGNTPTDKTGMFVQSGIDVIQGISMIKQQRDAVREAKQMSALTNAMGLAAASSPVQPIRRQYVRPEDFTIQPDQLSPSYGVGTNVLEDGGEIANTYAPNTLYDNLGYEPLDDSERYKQFYRGGRLQKAEGGFDFSTFMNKQGGNALAGTLGNVITGSEVEAGNKIGKGIGTAAGTAIGGPIGGAIGGLLGSAIGGIVDRSEEKIKEYQAESRRNMGNIMGRNFGMGIQSQFSSYMENGGTTSPYAWVSHTWQPQKIVSFGGHNLKDLLKPPHDADMLRAGGHLKAYTPPSAEAMSTERSMMQMGGELQTHWGGYAEPMSYNPYLPDGGETIMFRGQSHDESDGRGNTGIGITYGENPVEVERGEPAIKLKDGTSGDASLVVYGNLKIPNSYVPFLGNEAKGKKFKTYVADLSKKENKQNKKIDNATKMLEDLEVSTPIDRMTLNSLHYTMLGANEKLKDIADKKMAAASLQNAINDTAEEMGLVADDLARGKVKIDKKAFENTAQKGKKLKKVKALPTVPAGQQKGEVYWGNVTQADFEAMVARNPWYDWSNFDPSSKADVEDFQKAFNREAEKLGVSTRLRVDGALGEQTASAESLYGGDRQIPPIPGGQFNMTKLQELPVQGPTGTPIYPVTPYKRNTLLDVVGQVMPYLRPSDSEALNPMQLMGEMYALSNNQVEPVQAQTIQPQLDTPYDISLQDIVNENEATYRSQQRMVGYNPAVQGQLSAQKYAANAKVLGEQFRLNQAEKQRVYSQNRNLLNQYGLRSLDIFDRQYVRQAEALSKTKATTQAALNSISSKFLQNRLENRTLATMENLYNYRFDPRFRAVNMNAPFQPQIPTVYIGPDGKQYKAVPVLDAQGNIIGYQQQPATGAPADGSAVAPSTATPGIVPPGKVPAAAPAAPVVTPVPPPPKPTDVQQAPIDFEEEMLTEDELKGYGKKGITVSKKKRLNSSIVRAFKNL